MINEKEKEALHDAVTAHEQRLMESRNAAKHVVEKVEKIISNALRDSGLRVAGAWYVRPGRTSSWQEISVSLVFDDYENKESANEIL